MAEKTYFAPGLLLGGAVLAILSLMLWHFLPIPAHSPPFVATPLLALACGGLEMWRERARRRPRP
jgi:hypothetical protein